MVIQGLKPKDMNPQTTTQPAAPALFGVDLIHRVDAEAQREFRMTIIIALLIFGGVKLMLMLVASLMK